MDLLVKIRDGIKKIIASNISDQEKEKQLCRFFFYYQDELPVFYKDHYVEDLEWLPKPAWFTNKEDEKLLKFKDHFYSGFTKTEKHIDIFIQPKQAIGSTWLYTGQFDIMKLLRRLPSILMGTPDALPDLYAIKAGRYFICDDGNHRIYAAYLLDRPVKISYYQEYKNIYDPLGNRINIA